ncbi:hypothetical protein MCEGEM3_02726 [Oxalobacteraceae bacterium]
MNKLRCRPGDLAIVIQAEFAINLGRIVRIIGVDDRKGDILFPEQTPTWLVRCELPMTWHNDNKRHRRRQGPVPDAYLQPVRGKFMGKDIADGLLSSESYNGLPASIDPTGPEKPSLVPPAQSRCEVRILKRLQFEAALKKAFEGGADLSGKETP